MKNLPSIMKYMLLSFFWGSLVLLFVSCNNSANTQVARADTMDCTSNLPSRISVKTVGNNIHQADSASKKGMVWIPGGSFSMGSSDDHGRKVEYPPHPVAVSGFWMDATEVTNEEFRKFVEATGYITTAERKPDWEELKKQLPAGTPKPPDSVMVPAALVFVASPQPITLNDASQWWSWVKGACWKHPEGENSDIRSKDNYPVVQVSWDDAVAYAKWAGKRLPTEAEWEWAARAGLKDQPYAWGSEPITNGAQKTNIWQGHFPDRNTLEDGFATSSPVKSFHPNAYGLYDMAGNVWEWCSDWYDADFYAQQGGKLLQDPKGPTSSMDPEEPTVPKKIVRGGSFLCHASYCASYRVSARMKTSPDTGLEHTGFRCVAN
jgi:formylglycine-generating enzyme required for sulfatase activity